MEEGTVPIYNVKVKDKDGKEITRKAFDLEVLNEWLEMKVVGGNPLILDTKDVGENTTIEEFKGMFSWSIFIELNEVVKKALGLIKEEPKKEKKSTPSPKEPEPPKEPEVVEAQPEEKEEPVEEKEEDTAEADIVTLE